MSPLSPISILFPGTPAGVPATPEPAPPSLAQQFYAKYFGESPTAVAFLSVQKLEANGFMPPLVVYNYNPSECVSQACGQDFAALLGPIGGFTPEAFLQWPDGPSGLWFDSAQVAFIRFPGNPLAPFNVGDQVTTFLHDGGPDQALADIRARLAYSLSQALQ